MSFSVVLPKGSSESEFLSEKGTHFNISLLFLSLCFSFVLLVIVCFNSAFLFQKLLFQSNSYEYTALSKPHEISLLRGIT